jgi:iron complex outermembrane receptor protein
MLKQKPLAAAVALAWLGVAPAPALAQSDAGSTPM